MQTTSQYVVHTCSSQRLVSVLSITITSIKQVMFLPRFVCLSVCQLVTVTYLKRHAVYISLYISYTVNVVGWQEMRAVDEWRGPNDFLTGWPEICS